MTKFSIIIACRSITNYLRESIPYLKKQTYKNFEVLIVLDKKQKFDFNDDRFKIIESKFGEPGLKRNIGAKDAAGDVLAFLDDDAFPSENWLENANKYFRDSDVYALGGPAMTPPNAEFTEQVVGLILESYIASGSTFYRHIPSRERKISDFPSVNLFVNKKIFDKVNGFDTNFWPGEDTKLCLDIVSEMKRPFDYKPDLIVYHHRRNSILKYLKQVSRYGKHRGYFSKIFPDTSRVLSYFIPSIFVIFLFVGLAMSLYIKNVIALYIFVLSIYLVFLIVESTRAYQKYRNLFIFPYFIAGAFLTHVVYGTNFVMGLLKKPELKIKKYNKNTGNYLEG